MLEEKGVAYEHEPFFPFGEVSEEFERQSPLRLVPAMVTDEGPLSDSAAICAYIEAKHPEPPLVPTDPYGLARSTWFCAYADAIFRHEGTIFFQRAVRGHMMKQEVDQAAVDEAEAKMPEFFGYLDGQLEGRAYLCSEEMGLADITVASVLLNYLHSGGRIEPAAYPNLRGLLDRMFARETFERRIREDLAALSEISTVVAPGR